MRLYKDRQPGDFVLMFWQILCTIIQRNVQQISEEN